jgi:hypothetical protein
MVAVQIAFDFLRNAVKPARRRERVSAAPARDRSSGASVVVSQPADALVAHAPHATSPRHTEPIASDATVDVASLEASLRCAVSVPLRLTITDNRRTMISLRRGQQFVEVRLHHMFLQADGLTRDALADYLFLSDRRAARHISRFIEQHRARIRREAVRRPRCLAPQGTHHDLSEIFHAINQRYFGDLVDARITWGRDAPTRRTRRSIKLGSYTARERLIRVHPALDAEFVPRFFIEYIVYHEMLHQVLPPKLQRGRRDLHGPAFKAREREFADYALALRWESDNLDRLLRRRPDARRRPALRVQD